MSDTTFATPKAGITYSVYPQYEEPKKVCGNCKFWKRYQDREGWGRCINDNIPSMIDLEPSHSFHQSFGCIPFFEAKESEPTEGG